TDLLNRRIAQRIVEKSTGEELAEAGQEIDAATFKRIQKVFPVPEDPAKTPRFEVLVEPMQLSTTEEVLSLWADPPEELLAPTREQLLGKGLNPSVTDPKSGKVIVEAYKKIGAEAARRIEGLHLPSVTLLRPNRYVEATVDAEGNNVHDMEDALSEIYRTIRPGDPSTPE